MVLALATEATKSCQAVIRCMRRFVLCESTKVLLILRGVRLLTTEVLLPARLGVPSYFTTLMSDLKCGLSRAWQQLSISASMPKRKLL